MIARAALVLVIMGFVLPGPGLAAEEPTTSRVFQLHHRSVLEATLVIQPLLSEDGRISFQYQRSTLTVEDRPEVVEKVAELLGEFDREPAGYRLRVELLEGLRNDGDASGETVAVAAKVERMFPFAAYQRIASAVVEGRVGERGGVELGEFFALRFHAGSANLMSAEGVALGRARGEAPASATREEKRAPSRESLTGRPRAETPISALSSRFRLQQLTLLKRQEGEDGTREFVEVFRSNVTLAPGQSIVVGASASEESDRALVLIIEAELVEDE
jgi:hypothetical protein